MIQIKPSNNNENELVKLSKIDGALNDSETAHLIIDNDKVISSKNIDGLDICPVEIENGVKIKINLKSGIKIKNPVHMCFGVLKESAIQKIEMEINLENDSSMEVLAHCVFPKGKKIQHIMNSTINISENASFSYFEKHIHSIFNGIEVYPKAKVNVGKNAKFKTEFELLQGRVGLIDIDYVVECSDYAIMDMTSRINAKSDDIIKIKEIGHLNGNYSKGALKSRVACRDKSNAEVYNELIAKGDYARGHVDCQEILKDEGSVKAIPVVEVLNSKAHITHEAALGGVDNKQLECLMSRGISENEATELIIQGLLS